MEDEADDAVFMFQTPYYSAYELCQPGLLTDDSSS